MSTLCWIAISVHIPLISLNPTEWIGLNEIEFYSLCWSQVVKIGLSFSIMINFLRHYSLVSQLHLFFFSYSFLKITVTLSAGSPWIVCLLIKFVYRPFLPCSFFPVCPHFFPAYQSLAFSLLLLAYSSIVWFWLH